MAANVDMLKKRVPTNCTDVAHQSMRHGRPAEDAPRAGPPRVLPRGHRPRRRPHRLAVLEEGGAGEEDRPDEVGDVVGGGADGHRVRGERAEGEADRPDGEEHADPPAPGPRRPPRGADGVERALAVRPGAPHHRGAVGPPEPLGGDEGPRPAGPLAHPALGHLDPAPHPAHPGERTTWPGRHRYAPRRREGADTRGNIDERRHDRGHRPHGHLPRLRRQGGPHLRRLRAVVARPPRPPGRRPEHRRGARRRPRLRRPRLLRQRDRHPQRRRPRRPRPAVHRLPLHPDVLADPGLVAHRARPPRRRRGHRRPRRPRLPRLRHGAGRRRRHPARDAAGQRLGHLHGRQVAPGQGLRPVRRRAPPLVALPAGLRPLLRLPRRLHQPAPAPPAGRGQLPRRGRHLPRRLLPHRRPRRPGPRHDQGGQGVGPGPAVLPLRRPRRGARTPARQGRRHRRPEGPLRRRLGRAPRAPLPPPARDGRGRGGHRAGSPQRRARQRRAAVGRAARRGRRSSTPATWRCSRPWSAASTGPPAACSTSWPPWASSTTRS